MLVRVNLFDFYKTRIMKQVAMMITHLRGLVSVMLGTDMSYTLEIC